jgi:hypothetical protein
MQDQAHALSRLLFTRGCVTPTILSGCYLSAPQGQMLRCVNLSIQPWLSGLLCLLSAGTAPPRRKRSVVSRLYPQITSLKSVPKGLSRSVVDFSGCAIYVVIFAVVFECELTASTVRTAYIADSCHFHKQVFYPAACTQKS